MKTRPAGLLYSNLKGESGSHCGDPMGRVTWEDDLTFSHICFLVPTLISAIIPSSFTFTFFFFFLRFAE